MAKVKFIVDVEKEIFYLKEYIKVCGEDKVTPPGLNLLKKTDEEIIKELNREYSTSQFIEFANNLKRRWKKIEDRYFSRIKEITGYEWELKEYICIITKYIPGFSVISKGNIIILGNEFRKNDEIRSLPIESQLYILAHELFHLHYFEVARKEKLPIEATKIEIVESVPILVFFNDSELQSFWPSVTFEKAKASYKKVEAVYGSASKMWDTKKNYLEFLKEFANSLKKH
ncbi:MAG: hypothetical protein AABW80_03395 [Nanoarchaeota archaeon]